MCVGGKGKINRCEYGRMRSNSIQFIGAEYRLNVGAHLFPFEHSILYKDALKGREILSQFESIVSRWVVLFGGGRREK